MTSGCVIPLGGFVTIGGGRVSVLSPSTPHAQSEEGDAEREEDQGGEEGEDRGRRPGCRAQLSH